MGTKQVNLRAAVLASLLLVQLLASGLGNPAEYGSSHWAPTPTWETKKKLQALNFRSDQL